MSDFIDDSSPYYVIKYVFKYEEAEDLVIPIKLDKKTLELVTEDTPEVEKDWTKLDFNQCECCPLKTENHSHCPAAKGLSMFIERFADNLSHVTTKVAVVTPERTYYKETSLQNGIYSIMGLVTATSGCPIFHPLKPMARFHLPFSTVEETLTRALSFHLIRQYFEAQKQENIDPLSLDDLNETYKNIDEVNKGLLTRIRAVSKKDANQNALIVLDAFKTMLSGAIDDDFEDLTEYVFPETNFPVE